MPLTTPLCQYIKARENEAIEAEWSGDNALADAIWFDVAVLKAQQDAGQTVYIAF